MNYDKNKEVLRKLYEQKGLIDNFKRDSEYLEKAFNKIAKIWLSNLEQICEIKYLMIAEAPLWGAKESYIYNPNTPNTQFFHKSDLESILYDKSIHDKQDFINQCNKIGLLIVDISPFALNTEDTIINYRRKSKNNPYGLTKIEYQQLIKDTLPTFLELKIKAVTPKASDNIKVFFRYVRVKKRFQDIIADTLTLYNLVRSINDISEISQQGGGINRIKLRILFDLYQQ